MQCTVALNCYVAKALLKYQITAHRPCMAYIAKTRFVTLLSTKMLDTLEKIVMHAYREEFVTVQHHIMEPCISSTITQLLWPLYTQAKSA